MYSRWNVNRSDGLEVFNDEKSANDAFAVLKEIIDMGADVNAKDSFGNACIDRACLQARQILPTRGCTDRIFTPEIRFDISRIFKLLVENGADMNYIAPNAFGKTYKKQYENETVGEFI
jgi:ankyrin repeat protein